MVGTSTRRSRLALAPLRRALQSKASIRLVLVAAAATLFGAAGASPASAATVTPTQEVAGTSQLNGVACPTASTCVAVGNLSGSGPVVVVLTDGTPGAVQLLTAPGGGQLDSVACTSATTCFAVGHRFIRVGNRLVQQAILVPITDGIAGSFEVIPGVNALRSVACPTSTTCYAVGDSPTGPVVVVITNGVAGPAQPLTGLDHVSAVGCASATTCYVVGMNEGNFDSEDPADWDSKAVIVPLVDGVAGTPLTITGVWGANAVACTSATTCYVVAQGGFDYFLQAVVIPLVDGVAGEPQAVLGTGTLLNIACMSATTCQAVGFGDGSTYVGGIVVPIVNGVPGTPLAVDGSSGLQGVACASAATCVASGGSFTFPYVGVVVSIHEPPTTADACKNGGWASFRTPSFKNQGACVSSVKAVTPTSG